ncbi:MAG: hypothetical protein ACFFEL_03735 [Candidatus Thorarchaeota archaeon]
MTHVNKKMVLGLVVSFAFLIGTFSVPVSALQTNIVIEKYNQGYRSGANNHTYMYVEPDPLNYITRSYLHANVDMDYTQYRFDDIGWISPDSNVFADTNAPFNWQVFNTFTTGPFGNDATLPSFYDFTASDGSEFGVNTTLETRTYSLAFGQQTPVQVDAGFMYIGTLGVSGQEFIHLTVESKQDSVTWEVAILDPEGRYLTSYVGSGGDIWTIPFKPSIAGTYYVLFEANPSVGTFALFEFLPVAVSPTPIPLGEVISGKLPTGEIVIDPGTGSFVQEEKPPTTHTYRLDSPTDVASLTYSFNYGGLFDTQPELIIFTSGEFEYALDGGSRYSEGYGSPSSGEYFYRGGPYYVTVMGGDNTEYTLYNRVNSYGELPLNQEFQFENYLGATATHAYLLNVENASLLRVNSTALGGELSVRITGRYEDGFRNSMDLGDTEIGANLQGSTEYYLPAGQYLVELVVDDAVNEWIEFNIGPIVSETTTEIVDIGGFFIDTELLQLYNITVFINNADNVTAGLDVTIYDASGRDMYNAGMLIANRFDGSQIQPHPTYWANATFNYDGHDWHDSYAFVGICAYLVNNNTEIPATNSYEDYPLDLTIQLTNRMNDFYANIVDLDVSTGAASYNFTLPAPGGPITEFHGLRLNATPGTWYNVSVMTGAITARDGALYSEYDGRTHSMDWTALNDALVGPIADYSFQFGAISDNLLLELEMDQSPTDGFIWIQITPMETNTLDVHQITPLGPDLLGILGGIAIPAIIGVGIIVVVYIVYVKKYKS